MSDTKRQTDHMRDTLNGVYEKSREFNDRYQLSCPRGCGACCDKPQKVWATIAEMLPMAEDIVLRNDWEAVTERIKSAGDDGVCVSFRPSPGATGRGTCENYSTRPLVCALFGSSSLRLKSGERDFVGCGILKAQLNDRRESLKDLNFAAESDSREISAASLSEFINDNELVRPRPINEALKSAIEMISWSRYLTSAERFSTPPIEISAP